MARRKAEHQEVDSQHYIKQSRDDQVFLWWSLFLLVTSVGFATRLYKIHEPDHVCWDETHFGKMGSWYINRTFFFDVHPPLGKMLIGLSGKLTGYNGTFPFNKPGDKYLDHNYIGMRVFCVALGALLVPFSFVTTWDLTQSLTASITASSLVTFDVGLVTLSQYILLDPILLCFIFASFMGSSKILTTLKNKSFTLEWWFWMAWTGFFLSASVGVKFVGLFIVFVVGLQTAVNLWDILGDDGLSIIDVSKHLAARVFSLIILPIFLYIVYFWIHLTILSKSGSGDGFFSSAFQSQLEGNSLYNASMPRHVAYGSVITLKNIKTGGGYLHSHWHLYPEGIGSRQQQITGYSHKDENNQWLIKKYDTDPDPEKVDLVKNNHLIRLQHVVTARNLHSHKEAAPMTKRHYQVTGYGENGTGDANDVWRLEILDPESEDEELKTVTSRFRLNHYFMKCALNCNSKQLPKWGYEQMEVTCNPNVNDKGTIWNIEDNIYAKLPNVSVKLYAPSFLERFIESHAVMFQGNSGLKPKEGEVTSRPWHWPINYRGQFFSGHDYKIYLLGNPIIWWSNLGLISIYLLIQFIILIRDQRGCQVSEVTKEANDRLTLAGSWLFIAWFMHYVPFFAMGRVLYFHHYFPASVFSCLLSGVVLDYLIWSLPYMMIGKRKELLSHFLTGSLLAIIAYSFYLFSPLAYGIRSSEGFMPDSESHSLVGEAIDGQIESSSMNNKSFVSGPSSHLENLRWLESWEF